MGTCKQTCAKAATRTRIGTHAHTRTYIQTYKHMRMHTCTCKRTRTLSKTLFFQVFISLCWRKSHYLKGKGVDSFSWERETNSCCILIKWCFCLKVWGFNIACWIRTARQQRVNVLISLSMVHFTTLLLWVSKCSVFVFVYVCFWYVFLFARVAFVE